MVVQTSLPLTLFETVNTQSKLTITDTYARYLTAGCYRQSQSQINFLESKKIQDNILWILNNMCLCSINITIRYIVVKLLFYTILIQIEFIFLWMLIHTNLYQIVCANEWMQNTWSSGDVHLVKQGARFAAQGSTDLHFIRVVVIQHHR